MWRETPALGWERAGRLCSIAPAPRSCKCCELQHKPFPRLDSVLQGDEGGPQNSLPVTLAGASSQQSKERFPKEKHPTAIHKELAHRRTVRCTVYEMLHFRSSLYSGPLAGGELPGDWVASSTWLQRNCGQAGREAAECWVNKLPQEEITGNTSGEKSNTDISENCFTFCWKK